MLGYMWAILNALNSGLLRSTQKVCGLPLPSPLPFPLLPGHRLCQRTRVSDATVCGLREGVNGHSVRPMADRPIVICGGHGGCAVGGWGIADRMGDTQAAAERLPLAAANGWMSVVGFGGMSLLAIPFWKVRRNRRDGGPSTRESCMVDVA